MPRLSILPLTRNDTNETRTCEVASLLILQLCLIIIIITSLFIINHSSGYDDNSDKVSIVLWLSSFQSVYMLCILPFCTKHYKCFMISLIPYITVLGFSTNVFIENNKEPFQKTFAVYHFAYLVSNYIVILMGCILSICSKCNIFERSAREPVINYSIIPTINHMTEQYQANKAVCSICMETITHRGLNVVTKCQHKFHKKCIDEWLSHNNDVCPNCRKIIVE